MKEEEKEAIKYVQEILNYKVLYAHTGRETDFLRGIDKDKINTVLNLIETQKAEIEKRDRIIDKMAQELFIEIEPHFDTVEQCREYYTKLVEGDK